MSVLQKDANKNAVYTLNEDCLNRQDQSLNVKVLIPKNPYATVIIHHGYGGSIQSPVVERLSKVFFESGYVTVLPNTTNCLNDSGGNIESFTFSKHASDLRAVIGWTKGQDWFASRLELAGYSLGGYSTIDCAGADQDVKALYLVAPIFSGRFFAEGLEKSTEGLMNLWKEEGYLPFTNDQGVSFVAPYKGWKEWMQADAMQAAVKFRGAVSMVTAEDDPLVQPSHSDAMAKAFSGASFKTERIAGEDHFFSRKPGALENWAKSSLRLV